MIEATIKIQAAEDAPESTMKIELPDTDNIGTAAECWIKKNIIENPYRIRCIKTKMK